MNKNNIFLSFVITIFLAHAMQPEDVYGAKELVPELFSYQKNIAGTRFVQEIVPVVDTLTANPNSALSAYFSVEILKYENVSLERDSLLLDPRWNDLSQDMAVVNTLVSSPYTIVIAQKQQSSNEALKNTLFIPIQTDENGTEILESSTELLALALIAGSRHFNINTATITIANHNEMPLWRKLFVGYQLFRDKNLEKQSLLRQSFTLNFNLMNNDEQSLSEALTLAALVREGFDVQDTVHEILKSQPERRTKKLDHFLITGSLENNSESEKEAAETHQRPSLSTHYAQLKTIRSYLYRRIFLLIKSWYDYFYTSYRYWFTKPI